MAGRPLQSRAFSLLELMILLTIASILTLLAVPNLKPFIQNNRNITLINELQTSLNAARTEAVTRNNTVTLCGSANGTSCAAAVAELEDGWIVFVDIDGDGTVDAGDGILRVQGKNMDGTTVTYSDNTVITYASSGLAIAGSSGTFTLCDDRGADSARGLIIGVSGRPRVAMDSDDNGILEDDNNTDLSCAG
jgi:type IV fimbrial biogenesis protein FimT